MVHEKAVKLAAEAQLIFSVAAPHGMNFSSDLFFWYIVVALILFKFQKK